MSQNECNTIHFAEVVVCVTAYNLEKYISKALDSALIQITNFNYIIYVSEDKSTDSTLNILLDYQSRFPNTVFISSNKNNLGMMPNYLQTIERTNSRYIAILDGDDYWISPNKLQMQYDFLEGNPDYSLCWHDATIVDPNETPISTFSNRFKGRDYSSFFDLKQVVKWKVLGATSSLFFRNYKSKFPLWTRNLYGTEVIIFMAMRQKGLLKYSDKNYSCYRVHTSSQEASFDKVSKSLRNIKEEKLLLSSFSPRLLSHFSKKIIWNRVYLMVYTLSKGEIIFSLKMSLALIGDAWFILNHTKNEAIKL